MISRSPILPCVMLAALVAAAGVCACVPFARGETAQAASVDVQEKTTYPLSIEGPELPPVAPPKRTELLQSLERGVDFLLETQLDNGAWGSAASEKYYLIWAPVPSAHQAFRTATTSLCLMALCEVRDHCEASQCEKIEAAIDRGQTWLLEHGDELRRSAPDAYDNYYGYALYNVWGHSFAIHAIVYLHERAAGNEELQTKLKKLLEYEVDRLKRDEYLNGGWGYYDDPFSDRGGPRQARMQRPTGSPISFTTATALIALKEAEKVGVKFPRDAIDKAIASLHRHLFADFAYAYGEYLRYYPRMDINRPGGSLGRSQVCNLALRLWGDELVTDEVLATWLKRLIARNGWLSMSRKRNYPNESPHFADFSVAGYFYYYGHFYAAICVEQLPPQERSYYQNHLARLLMPLQEKDGSWWDYILYDYHRQYGTAMALSTLVRCLPE